MRSIFKEKKRDMRKHSQSSPASVQLKVTEKVLVILYSLNKFGGTVIVYGSPEHKAYQGHEQHKWPLRELALMTKVRERANKYNDWW